MALVLVRGSGHQSDPFQILITLTHKDVADARAPASIVAEPPNMPYDADPQIRTVIVQVADD